MKRALFAWILIVTTLPALAALSPSYADWAKGPVKWLMTADDQRDWKALSNDAEAAQYIDLFWARRDSTPGTRSNELRRDFENRVTEADLLFASLGKQRGSLTQPGRVYILLGAPDYQNARLPRVGNGIESAAAFDKNGNAQVRDLGHSFQTIAFDYVTYLARGLTSENVRFAMSPVTREYELVIEANNATGALEMAARGAIHNPALTTVPGWAVDLSAGQTLPPGEGQAFRIVLAIASMNVVPESDQFLSADVRKAIGDMKGFLPYKSYRTIDSRLFRCRSGRPWPVELNGYGGATYLLSIAYRPDETGRVSVYRFNVIRDGSPRTPLLSTSFALAIGETVSVGSSTVPGSKDAIVFFVTSLGK